MGARARLRRRARDLRHTPDRVAHRFRRTAARRRVSAGRPHRVLVLCLGNICRSPYAAGVLARALPDCEVRSAGFLEAGRPPPREAVSVAAERGINLSGHRSVRVTPEGLDWADLVLVMDGRQRARATAMAFSSLHVERLGDFDPAGIDTRTILDPIDRDRAYFVRVYERIDACCKVLADTLSRSGGGR